MSRSDIDVKLRKAIIEGKDFNSIMEESNLSLEQYIKAFNKITGQSNRKYKKQSMNVLPFRLDVFLERMNKYKKYCDDEIRQALSQNKAPDVAFIKMGSDIEHIMFQVENSVYQNLVMHDITREEYKKHMKGQSNIMVKREEKGVF